MQLLEAMNAEIQHRKDHPEVDWSYTWKIVHAELDSKNYFSRQLSCYFNNIGDELEDLAFRLCYIEKQEDTQFQKEECSSAFIAEARKWSTWTPQCQIL